jgi:UDP-N-acetylmuramoyl-tripeptide--D-alanyl-D-alanine ligase
MSEHLTTDWLSSRMRAHGYEVHEGPVAEVRGGAADSRKVVAGDLFTAFPGENSDGNVFVAEALENGAVAAICERAPEGAWPGKTIVVAPDATRAVGELAHEWRRECGTHVVGITGTVGKTTAKEMTAAALGQRFQTHRSGGNFNSREGLPLALMSLRRDHEVSVLEMGMDSVGEIRYLCDIGEPEVGVVLNIGLTHVSKMGSIEAIAAEKLSLPRWLGADGTAVLNLDDARIAAGVAELRCHVMGFGAGADAELTWSVTANDGLGGIAFRVRQATTGEVANGHSPIPGEHTMPAVMAATGCGLALGMTLTEIVDAISASDAEGRARTVNARSGATIIDDRYNSSPASLAGALRMLGSLSGRRIGFLGRMAELGAFEEDEHRKAGVIAATSCDVLVAVGAECLALAEGARAGGLSDVRWFETKEEAARALAGDLGAGDFVLVKASRGAAFETVLPMLEGAE